MSNSEDWAIAFKKRTEAKADAEYQELHATALKRAIVKEKTPQLWEDLLKTLEAYADSYNRHNDPRRKLTPQRPGTHVFLVRWDAGPEIVTAHYNPTDHTIMVKGGAYAETYLPRAVLSEEGRVELMAGSSKRVCTLDNVAQAAFEAGIGI